METFPVVWLAAFVIPLALSLGLGLLLQRVKRSGKFDIFESIVGGFALLVTLGSITTLTSVTAKLTTPLVVALSLIGFFTSRHILKTVLRPGFDFLLLFATYIFATLPLISAFKVTWPGWVQLDDTGTFLAITNHIMKNGQVVPSEITSTYDRTLQVILGGSFYGNYDAATNAITFSYPIGSLVPLGVTSQVTQIDLAWLFFPYLAFCIAISAGLFFTISRTFINNRYLAGTVAITTSMASTLYAYALWGGIKEVVLVPLLTYSLMNLVRVSKANIFPTVISSAGIFAVGGTSGLGFIFGQAALVFLFKLLKRNQSKFTKRWLIIAALLVVVSALLARPVISLFNKYFIPEIPDSGNLARSLNFWQILGVWPSGDFRGDVYWQPAIFIGLSLIALLAIFGLITSFLSDQPTLTIGLLVTLAISIYSSQFSGIWLTGKAIAVASPFFLLVIFYGISRIIEIDKLKVLGQMLLITTILGVATSNFLGFRHTWVAPTEKVRELQKIGQDFAGKGPTLMTDYAVLASRYFLRDLNAESASELRVNLIPMRDGTELLKGFSADIDLFDNTEISNYELLVLRHTATGSRPLFNYDLAFKGKFYDVWQKNKFGNSDITSIPLGNNYIPGEELTCNSIRKRIKDVSGNIRAAIRKPISIVNLSDGQLPENWKVDDGNLGAVKQSGPGYLQGVLEVTNTGDYEWFMGGSYPGKLKIFLDREEVFVGKAFFEGNKFLSTYLFTGKVSAGKHLIEIRYSKPLLQVGAGVNESLGPIYLSNETAAESKILDVSKDKYKELCNKELDWIAWVK